MHHNEEKNHTFYCTAWPTPEEGEIIEWTWYGPALVENSSRAIIESDDAGQSRLTITSLSPSDEGSYVCSLTRNGELASATFQLTVVGNSPCMRTNVFCIAVLVL